MRFSSPKPIDPIHIPYSGKADLEGFYVNYPGGLGHPCSPIFKSPISIIFSLFPFLQSQAGRDLKSRTPIVGFVIRIKARNLAFSTRKSHPYQSGNFAIPHSIIYSHNLLFPVPRSLLSFPCSLFTVLQSLNLYSPNSPRQPTATAYFSPFSQSLFPFSYFKSSDNLVQVFRLGPHLSVGASLRIYLP